MVHINNRLKTIGKSYKPQPCLSKQEIDNDESYEEVLLKEKK